jgi:DNA topoisomerase-1
MAKELVIVESPAKARTIGRFLGNKYSTRASMGHVRDLPKREMGITIENNHFNAKYTVPPDKRKLVSELTKEAKSASKVFLATDPDREGEAISWHLIKAAKIDESKVQRVVFHEITPEAIRHAFDNPRPLDTNLIDAQQARRVLDRLVGYDLSPVLWKKIKRGLSAGRVQSVALKLIADREKKISIFVPTEYWNIETVLRKSGSTNGSQNTFNSTLRNANGTSGTFRIPNQEVADHISHELTESEFSVAKITKKQKRIRPAPPFITSTLQQEAWRKLRFSARRTMVLAQQLYEGIDITGEDPVGLISYMRTDSTTLSNTALAEAAEYIRDEFGNEYLPKSPRIYKRKVKGAQEAHEAVRPTSIKRDPHSVKAFLNRDQLRLYEMIWKRTLASQMVDAILDSTSIDIHAKHESSDTTYDLRSSGSILKFQGFRKLYFEDTDDKSNIDPEKSAILPDISEGETLNCLSVSPEQKFTQPPARYSEATLIKTLEEEGIGRPSTYAPTIATVMDREYVVKEKGRFAPTKLGTVVNDLLSKHFPDIIDIGFTARLENELDDVANGDREWIPLIRDFYNPFYKTVELAMEKAERVSQDQIDEESDESCEVCERRMVIKSGRYGKFLSCSGFPECQNSKPFLARIGVACPDCDSDIVERSVNGKRKKFYGCSNYPTCTYATNQKPLVQPCPECSQMLVASGKGNARCTTCKYKGPIPEESTV